MLNMLTKEDIIWKVQNSSKRKETADLSEGGEPVVHWLVPLLVNEAGVGPGVVTVVGEGEGPGPQPVVHPQHCQAGADAVA